MTTGDGPVEVGPGSDDGLDGDAGPPDERAPRRLTGRRVLVGVAVVLLAAGLAVAVVPPVRLVATYVVLSRVTLSHFEIEDDTVVMVGAVNGRTPDQFEALLDANPAVDTLELADVTGSIDDEATFRMARIVRERGLATVVPADGRAESGGVDLFIAGVERTVGDGARLGVHEWQGFTSTATDFPRSAAEHDRYLDFYTEMLGAPDFYWFTIEAAPPDGMHHLTPSEIDRFGITTG